MRNDALKHAIVLGLSLLITTADAIAMSSSPASGRDAGRHVRPTTITGTLEAGATTVHRLRLERSVPAFVQLASVSPTGEVGLQLVSARGVPLDRDFTDNARPEVATVPSGSGTYEVQVTMTTCAMSTCAYVLSVVTNGRAAKPHWTR